jgi:hypothetical protein
LLGSEPGQEVQEDLRRFKQVIETGEVVLSDATVHGRPHPAQPPEGTFRLPTPVPGAGIARSTTGTEGEATSDWPDPDDRPAHRAAADDAATVPTRGGAR